MITYDDKLFCILTSCEESIKSSRLVCYMYLFQSAGYDFNFRYNLSATGLKSKGLSNYIDLLVNEGKIETKRGTINPTSTGLELLDSFVLSLDEVEFHDYILDVMKDVSFDDLYFIVVTDMVISETKKQKGVEGLISDRAVIEETVSHLSGVYSKENFDAAVKFLNIIRKGRLG